MHSSTSQSHSMFPAKLMTTGIIVHDAAPEQKKSNSSWFHRVCNDLMHYLLRGHEPKIWQKRNAEGEVFYRVYDPRSGRSVYLSSEVEVRAWLEQMPYQ